MSTPEENKRIAIALLEASAKHDGAAFDALLHPEATYWVIGKPHLFSYGGEQTREQIVAYMSSPTIFINGGVETTYGDITAEGDRVAVEAETKGTLPDGTPYTANDPALLTWVHVAEVDSFLRAYLRYRDPRMSVTDQERYVAETATVAEALGATDVPRSRAEIEAYFARIRPELRADHRTREVAAALLAPGDDKATTSAMNLAVAAAIDLLPPWAQALHGRSLPAFARPAVRMSANGMGGVLRWALKR